MTLALNAPGPVAVARLVALGATAVKVEPKGGDPLAGYSRDWYDELHRGVRVVDLDLRTPDGLARLDAEIGNSDVLVTSQRCRTLRRIGLDSEMRSRHRRLCHVAIVGHPRPRDDEPGHDVTYLAAQGLLTPPGLPRTLAADLLGAARAVEAVLSLLLARASTGSGGRVEVSLATAAADLAAPMRYGLTTPGGVLGGGFAPYGLYRAADGWIALGALEAHFVEGVRSALGIPRADHEGLAAAFAKRTTAEWVAWARDHDLPLEAVAGI